jgi:hypothetical protein
MAKMQVWVRNSLLTTIKKNYYHKKTGARLTLDEKHEWDRVVKPIEHAIGKVLVVHPYTPPVVVVDSSKAMLLALKSGAAPPKETGNSHSPSSSPPLCICELPAVFRHHVLLLIF